MCRFILIFLLSLPAWAAEPAWQSQSYAPAPVDNPLKGLVPYASSSSKDQFPHSMEFSYFPLSAVVKGPQQYEWREIERFLDAVAGRGNQAVLRFHAEYPGKSGSVPGYLLDDGVRLIRWQRASTPPRPPVEVETPDYRDPRLRQMLVDFIAAFGAHYDGDPRIGFITAGLLGLWGEWHDYPRVELFADKALQQQVMDGYAQAFRQTPVLLRYPAAESDSVYVGNAAAPFGYHDDSFAWNTLPSRPHYFVAKLQKAGAQAEAKWQTHPIGGEIRPEAWGKVFDSEPALPALQDFAECVEATHVSWLMDSGMFKFGNSPERITRALAQVRRMGYELHVAQVALSLGSYLGPQVSCAVGQICSKPKAQPQLNIQVRMENRGVAPLYPRWQLEWALLNEQGKLVHATRSTDSPAGILPKGTREFSQQIILSNAAAGRHRVLLRVVNPLPNGKPLRFANSRQDADQSGWLTLGELP